MKLKLVVVDFELPTRVKKWLLRAGLLGSVLGVAAIAYAAAPLHTWSTGDTLQASELNANFQSLDQRLLAFEDAGLSKLPMARAYWGLGSGIQALSNGTAVFFPLTDYDIGGGVQSASPFTYVAPIDGLFELDVAVNFTAMAAAGDAIALEVHVNGVSVESLDINHLYASTITNYSFGAGHDNVRLHKGDALQIVAFIPPGGGTGWEAGGGHISLRWLSALPP